MIGNSVSKTMIQSLTVFNPDVWCNCFTDVYWTVKQPRLRYFMSDDVYMMAVRIMRIDQFSKNEIASLFFADETRRVDVIIKRKLEKEIL